MTLTWWHAYWLVAILWSVFLARVAYMVFTDTSYAAQPRLVRVFQCGLNFSGGIAGFGALYYVLWYRIGRADLGVIDLLFLVLAFWGITGYLPYFLVAQMTKLLVAIGKIAADKVPGG